MTEAPGSRPHSSRVASGAAAVAAVLAAGAAWLSQAGAQILAEDERTAGAVLVLYSLALAILAGTCLLRPLRGWLLLRAARRPRPAGGSGELGAWPGLRERGGRLAVRCGRPSLRFWVPASGLVLSAVTLDWLGRGALDAAELVLSLVPAGIVALVAGAWGPSGWKLVLDVARQNLTLERFGAFRRVRDFTASLPTVQAVRFTDDGRGRGLLVVGLTKGLDWQLDLPPEWPAELGRALAARMANLVGIEEQENGGRPPEPEAVPMAATASTADEQES